MGDRRLRRVFNMSGSEIIVILLLALVVLGPEKLPDAMRKAGKAVSELRRMGSAFQSEMHDTMDEPMREMRDTANLLRGATDFKTTARRAVSGLTTTSSDDEPAADTKTTPPTAAAATNPVSASLEAAVAESSGSDDAATVNGDLATTTNGDAADAGHPDNAPDDTAPATPPTSIERALRGDSTIDRATAGEDGTTSA